MISQTLYPVFDNISVEIDKFILGLLRNYKQLAGADYLIVAGRDIGQFSPIT
ncbi:hypothetical protein CHISP_2937 [Chitinispirillum alkaliphilum]|nr:hypothetical protein CHISP_2937 [Chitinispirillum alkaliphilum]